MVENRQAMEELFMGSSRQALKKRFNHSRIVQFAQGPRNLPGGGWILKKRIEERSKRAGVVELTQRLGRCADNIGVRGGEQGNQGFYRTSGVLS